MHNSPGQNTVYCIYIYICIILQARILEWAAGPFSRNILSICRCQASVCASILSRHNKGFEWWRLDSPWLVTALGCWTVCVIALKQISVTALFYLENRRRIHARGKRACRPKDMKRRAPQHAGGGGWGDKESVPWLLFLYVFFLPLGLPCVNWTSQ